MPRYLNPYTDFGFKKLFGEEVNKDLLIDFLNQMLPPHHQIAEMQKAKMDFFKDRAVFYVTFPIRDQSKKGKWNFQLDPVYFIAILDFEFDEHEKQRKFRRDIALRDSDGELFFDKLHFKFLQIPLFNKKEHELKTRFDKWLYFLKNLENLNHIPAILNEPIFHKAFHTAELANLTRKQHAAYNQTLLDYWTMKAVIETAHNEGREEGREEGLAEGLVKGQNAGQVIMLRTLLKHRFGALPAWVEYKLTQATFVQLEKWGLQVLHSESLLDIFKN